MTLQQDSDRAERRATGRRRMWSRHNDAWLIGAVAAILVIASAVILATASPDRHRATAAGPPTSPPTTSAEGVLAAAITYSPADLATDVPLDAPVVVKTARGKFIEVVAETKAGQILPGTFNATGTVWTSAAALLPTSNYSVQAEVIGGPGQTAGRKSSFTTLTPKVNVTASLAPASSAAIGVGQPIALVFSQPVTSAASRQSLLSHVHVSMSKPAPVGAYWFSDTELHIRPETYWGSGTQVTVSYNLAGWDVGGGAWGSGSGTRRLNVGTARVSTLDLTTQELTVTVSGTVVAVDHVLSNAAALTNGIHIVLSRQTQDNGLYWIVGLSDDGTSICGVGPSGSSSASSCAALSLGDAERFYYTTGTGDVVTVTGAQAPPSATDRSTADWNLPWSDFTPLPVTEQGTSTSPTGATHTQPSESHH